jgi:hypothetical protein
MAQSRLVKWATLFLITTGLYRVFGPRARKGRAAQNQRYARQGERQPF